MAATVGSHILDRLRRARRRARLRLSRATGSTASSAASTRSATELEFIQAAPRGARRVRGVRPRQVHRRGRRVHGDLRARARSTCSTASTTPSSTTSRWWRSSASRRAISLGSELPAGGRPADAVQGRRGRVRAGRDGARAGAHLIDRAIRIARATRSVTCVIVPNDVQEEELRGAAARARRGLLGRAASRARTWCPAGPTLRARRGRPQRRRAGRDAGRRRARAARAPRSSEVAERARLPASPRRSTGAPSLPDDLPYVTGSIGLLGHASRATT